MVQSTQKIQKKSKKIWCKLLQNPPQLKFYDTLSYIFSEKMHLILCGKTEQKTVFLCVPLHSVENFTPAILLVLLTNIKYGRDIISRIHQRA